MNNYYEIFKRNFPFVVRDKEKALEIINNPENKFIDVYDDEGNIIGTSIIYKDTILMLCVDKDYRNKGIGTKLLNDSESYILDNGYNEVKVGVGDNQDIYLMPGIPMATKPFDQVLKEDDIYKEVTNEGYDFFSKRGYFHSWTDANCFDMRVLLEDAIIPDESIGDTIDGITYRFATIDDIPSIIKCTDDAWPEFSPFYEEEIIYDEKSPKKVLIATKDNDVCGTLMICIETEGKDLGSVGCTSVANAYRGKHIAVNMVKLGTKYLKSLGLKNGFLGYTYSPLDRMYGHAGYKICVYYDMAHKSLDKVMKMTKI